MNKQQRKNELKEILETPLKTSFSEAHKQIEELMQRPVWTHEMAYPEMLYKEIINGKKGETFRKSLKEISKRKPIIIVETK